MPSLHPYTHCLFLFLFSLLFILLSGPLHTTAEEACSGRYLKNIGGDSIVCVCDSKGCPPLLPPHPPAPSPTTATATTYTTSRGGQRFKEGTVEVVRDPSGSSSDSSSSKRRDVATVVEVAVDAPKQVMNGFGGAFTDSAAITMSSLSPHSLDALLRAYFSPEGLEYTLLRVPIGGADFSLHPYTYADTPPAGDGLNFALADEDVKYKLPLLRRALGLGRRSPRVLASPWSAPAWMKTNGKINENGELLEDMWHTWTDYLLKFIKEYESASVPIWAITAQNHGFDPGPTPWNSMYWSPDNLREWIKTSLGPALHEAGLKHVKVYVGDDNRDTINCSREVLNDPGAAKYITGVALHWYLDWKVGPQVLEQTHLLYPDKDILGTEACIVPSKSKPGQPAVLLGSWERAEKYALDIFEDVNHYASGWIDWNLCLDLSGGPNWAGNVVDAPVIINQERDEFYLQPMFFIMGHFSKFVPPGSVTLHSWVRDWRRGQAQDHLYTSAFIHPDGNIVLQLLNTDDTEIEVRAEWGRGTYLHTALPPRAIQTLLLPWEGQRDHEKKKYHSPEDLDAGSRLALGALLLLILATHAAVQLCSVLPAQQSTARLLQGVTRWSAAGLLLSSPAARQAQYYGWSGCLDHTHSLAPLPACLPGLLL